MSECPPSNIRSLRTRIRNLARAQDVPEGRLQRLLAVGIVGQLFASADVGVVKGATNIELRVGTLHTRVSSDLDTVRRVSIEQFRLRLGEALAAGWHGFSGQITEPRLIATPAPSDYQPHRLTVKLMYHSASFTSLTVEVSPEEVGALTHGETVASTELSVWCRALGLPQLGPVPTLPLSHQIAQKLHACTAPDTPDWLNPRVHDLVDLQIAVQGLTDPDYPGMKAAATRLFRARRGHPWPPTVTSREGWQDRYQREAAGMAVLDELEDAIRWANDLIAEIDAAPNAEIDSAIRGHAQTTSYGDLLAAEGVTTVALDDDGTLVEYHPDGSSTPLN